MNPFGCPQGEVAKGPSSAKSAPSLGEASLPDEEDIPKLRAEVATGMLDHVLRTGGRLATPGDELARLRRDVLRGLSGKPIPKPHRKRER